MSNKKRRNKRRRRDQSECCILCMLYAQAREQDASWSLSDRADELAARMRAMQQWGGDFTDLIRSSRESIEEFATGWASHRDPRGEPVEVAVLALDRFWSAYQSALA